MEAPPLESHGLDRSEAGFALLTVLLVLIGVTAVASAGFILSDSDYRASQNHRSSVHAFLAANAGLYEYVGDQKTPDTKRTYAYATGDADVGPRQLLDLGDGRVLYRIASRATYDAPEGGTATYSVSTTAIHAISSFEVTAPIVSLTTLHKNGGSGRIDGEDAASDGDCDGAKAAEIAGVAVQDSGYDQSGGSSVPEGSPDILEDDIPGLIDLIGLDWQAVLDGDLVRPDYTVPPDSWPSIGADEWPVIHVTGDISVDPGNSGQGTLIVEGGLTMNGGFDWDGIILVGDNFISNGNNEVMGTLMAGLNVMLGQTPPDSDLGNGVKTFRYHSCNIKWAMESAFGGLHEVPGTWTESM
ncbi:MAG: hypothetical protein P8Y07_10155 [Gemmatimonadales bacterium]|jgi:hypothetical protein